MNTVYLGFILGIVICDIYVNKNFIQSKISELKLFYKFILFSIATILAAVPAYISNVNDFSIIFKPLTELFSNLNISYNVAYSIASCVFIILLLSSSRFTKIFELKPLVFLGSISYSLYATHLIILGTIGSYVFVKLNSYLSYNYSLIITSFISIITALGFAALMKKYVDQPSISLSQNIGRLLNKRSS